MKRLFAISLSLLVLATGIALGQAPPKAKAAPAPVPAAASQLPPGVTISDPAYPLPVEEKLKFRDQQLEYDELEIENQRMLLKVEENKKRQDVVMNSMQRDAFQLAEAKHIDRNLFQFDAKELKFVTKKAATK